MEQPNMPRVALPSFRQLFKDSFARMGQNWQPKAIALFAYYALTLLFGGVASVLMIMADKGTASSAALIWLAILGMIVLLFLLLWSTSAFISLASGRETALGGAYRYALGKVGTVFVVGLLVGIMQAIGFVFLVAPAIVIAVPALLVAYVVIAEDKGINESLSSAWSFAKGFFWTMLYRLLSYLFCVLIPLGIVSSLFEKGAALIGTPAAAYVAVGLQLALSVVVSYASAHFMTQLLFALRAAGHAEESIATWKKVVAGIGIGLFSILVILIVVSGVLQLLANLQ